MLAKEFITNVLNICKNNLIETKVNYIGNDFYFRALTDGEIGNIYIVSSNKFRVFLIQHEIKLSTEAYYCDFSFMCDNGHILDNFQDLPKNIYDWTEEDFFYFNLKYVS